MLLIRVVESLTWLREATYVTNFYILTPLLEPLLNIALHIKNLLFHGRVPVIFNRVVGTTFQICGNDSPLIIELTVQNVQNELFFITPLVFLNLGVQMVMPALTALLSNTTRQIVGNVCPFHCACGLYER